MALSFWGTIAGLFLGWNLVGTVLDLAEARAERRAEGQKAAAKAAEPAKAEPAAAEPAKAEKRPATRDELAEMSRPDPAAVRRAKASLERML